MGRSESSEDVTELIFESTCGISRESPGHGTPEHPRNQEHPLRKPETRNLPGNQEHLKICLQNTQNTSTLRSELRNWPLRCSWFSGFLGDLPALFVVVVVVVVVL